jgi:hypothetical protein
MGREERREFIFTMIVRTHMRLWELGLVGVVRCR